MATHHHPDDEQAKKPDESHPAPKPPGSNPRYPNLSIDEPAEEVFEAEVFEDVAEVVDDAAPVKKDAPASDIAAEIFADDVVEAPSGATSDRPESDVFVLDDADAVDVPASPKSSASHVVAEEVVEEAMPVSEVFAAEEVVDEAAPVSEAVVAEEVIEEASPFSDVAVAEEVIEEASPASSVLDDDIAEAVAASEAQSAELAEEVAEAVEEPSSATRKSESVFDDDVAEAVAASSATRRSESVLEDDDVEVAEAASALDATEFNEPPSSGRSRKRSVEQTAAFEQTMAFDPPPSASKKAPASGLVTEEDVDDSADSSSVNLGSGVHKGSSVSGIDMIAEELESGVEINDMEATAPPTPSVEFDDLLDEDAALPASKKGKSARKAKEEVTDLMDPGTFDEPKKGAKSKKKATPVATGDDIDLDAMFRDEEAEAEEALEAEDADVAEALDADEAEEAEEEVAEAEEALEAEEADFAEEALEAEEAEEAFADEVEAAEADDDEPVKPTKGKGKAAIKSVKKKRTDEDDEDLAQFADEEEDEDWRSKQEKKRKKEPRELATPAPAAGRPSTLLRVFIGMVLATIGLAGAAAAGLYFAPDPIMDFAKDLPRFEERPSTPQPKDKDKEKEKDKDKDKDKDKVTPQKTNLELASTSLIQGRYDEVIKTHLKDAKDPAEKVMRGQAKWLAYVKDQFKASAPLDPTSARVTDARSDLEAIKANPFLEQVDAALRIKGLNEKIASLEKAEKDLTTVKAEKAKTEKAMDAVADTLVKNEIIKNKADLQNIVELQKVAKALAANRTTLAAVNKLLMDNEFKSADKDGLVELLKQKQSTDEKLEAVAKVLEEEKIKDEGAKGVLAIIDVRNKLKKDRDELDATVIAAFKELVDGKILPESPEPRAKLLEGVKLARMKSESPLAIPLSQLGLSLGAIGSNTGKIVEQSVDMTKVIAELGFFRGREKFIESPEQKMNTYISLLQDRTRNNPKWLLEISNEADWILLPESKATDESRAKARFVQGLALRNEEKFEEARTAMAESLKMAVGVAKSGSWVKKASELHRELVDPYAYFLPRIAGFHRDGDLESAEKAADLGLKAIPDNTRLIIARGMVRFDQARGGAKFSDDAVKAIRADAEAAAADEKTAADAAYLLGLVEEQLGNLPKAEDHYRKALKLHGGDNDGAFTYRVALGRLLLRERPDMEPEEKKVDEKKKDDEKKIDDKKKVDEKKVDEKKKDDEKKVDSDKKDDAPKKAVDARTNTPRVITLHPWTLLAVTVTIGQPIDDDVDDPATVARLNETIKLANELIASKSEKIRGQGYVLLGSALSRLGKRTDGLREFAKGMKLIYPGIEVEELNKLIEDHPAFQQPDNFGTPNPIMGDRHFGEGLHFYWAKEYRQAEIQFRQAIKYYEKDARYQYFLGLSQYMQNSKAKRDAAFYNWEKGANLEAKAVISEPNAARMINSSLERVQGPIRQKLNEYRFKATEDREDKMSK